MTYLERRQVRKIVIPIVAAQMALAILFTLRVFTQHAAVATPSHVSLASALAAGAFPATIVATVLTGAFCRTNVIIDLMWTRPIARERLALSIIGVDLAGIFATWLISFVVAGAMPLVLAGVPLAALSFDGAALRMAIALAGTLGAIYGIGIGISFMFRMQSRTLTVNAWGISLVAILVAIVFTIPVFHAASPLNMIAMGGPVAMMKACAAPGPVLQPIFGVDAAAWSIATYALALAGIAATTIGWRRVQF